MRKRPGSDARPFVPLAISLAISIAIRLAV
jgi:hypothetical protein